VLVVSAGTADLPVAEEAALSAELMGNRVERVYDVGVAGLHRLLERREQLWAAAVLIVVAGMEGALPSVVGGLVDRPVIAVPTSVGYGTSLGASRRSSACSTPAPPRGGGEHRQRLRRRRGRDPQSTTRRRRDCPDACASPLRGCVLVAAA